MSCQDVSKMENFVVSTNFTRIAKRIIEISFQMGERKGEICPQDPPSRDGGRVEEVQCSEETEGGGAGSC